MKKTIIYGTIVAFLALFSGCDDFTDITPKGKNILERVTDLDQLLNYRYERLSFEAIQLSVLVNDAYPLISHIPNLISNPIKTLNSVLVTWDEQADRAGLTLQDNNYTDYYAVIGGVANPVLLKIDEASGDRELAVRLKAEAYVLRAYFHYLAVNVFAKAYHPATAATDPGVPYVKEHDLLSVPSTQYTVQEVYDFILADLQAAFDLNSLPDVPVNLMRVSLPFAHAVEAKVRMSMHDFPGALQAAEKSLAIKNTIDDHRPFVGGVFSRPELESSEDLFFAGNAYVLYKGLTPDFSSSFEPGSIFHNTIENVNAYALMYHGIEVEMLFAQTVYYSASGLTTVDMFLTLAECKIRSGDIDGAMHILNDIREYRIDPELYQPLSAANATEAFAALKKLSRTENWCGPKNFINLKRWNTENAYKETLRKTLLGVDYALNPDSPLWIFPFPQNATGFNPNLIQNYEY